MVQEATRCEALLAAELGIRDAQPQVQIEDYDVKEADSDVAASVLVFDVDMTSLVDGTTPRRQFEQCVQQEVGDALGIQPAQIHINTMTCPGGVLDFEIRTQTSDNRSALDLRDDLHSQIADEGSKLHSSASVVAGCLNPTASITALSAIVSAQSAERRGTAQHVASCLDQHTATTAVDSALPRQLCIAHYVYSGLHDSTF